MDKKVYIAGAGPGDKGLITLKTFEILKWADVVVYDRLINKDLLNETKTGAELIYVGKQNTEGGKIQDRINEILVEKYKENKSVLRLKGGDPFMFGRGGEEIEKLIENSIPFEVIPGISSSMSVPAYAGIPVTHRGVSPEFHVFTGHRKGGEFHLEFDKIAPLEGTIVFLMGVGKLPEITHGLISHGKDKNTPIALIEKGTTAYQRVTTGTLENIVELAEEKGVVPPAIIIVGEVVNLRDKFKWRENSAPLLQKQVIINRDKNPSTIFSDRLQKLGADTVITSAIEIEYINKEITGDIKDLEILLFNSANGVRAFLNIIDDIRVLANKKIGAVGSATLDEFKKWKIKPDIIPEKYLLTEMIKIVENYRQSNKIGIICSDISPTDFDGLNRDSKHKYQKIEVYKTKEIEIEKDRLKGFDGAIMPIFSGSAVHSMVKSNIDLNLYKLVSIGPMTSKIIKDYGYDVALEAEKHNSDGVLESILKGVKDGIL